MLAMLDADSLGWILSYNFREHMDEPTADIEIARAADDFVKTILTIVQADSYVGVFTPEKTFRQEVYKYAKYKGERPERPDWFQRFGPVIKSRLIEKWGFFTVPDLEADDVICALAEYYEKGRDFEDKYRCIICSPDKDLRQIPGYHYDYKKEGATPFMVSEEEASLNFWTQMLVGCSGDNIKALPGLGEKKVEALFKGVDPFQYSVIVMAQYVKYFGNYYGPIIYQETKDALQLMSSKHRLWYKYENYFGTKEQCDVQGITFLPGEKYQFNNTLEEDSPFSEGSGMKTLIEQAEMLDPYGTIEKPVDPDQSWFDLFPNRY